MTSVMIIQPDPQDPPERFRAFLESEGFDVRVVRPFLGDPVPSTLTEDALIVLGGDMSAADVADHPWLADVMALLRAAVSASTPTLGICLGGQLLAASLGGTVEPGAAGMEAGVVEVQPREGARLDDLFAGAQWPLTMITMHRDAITLLPIDAVWLAASEPYEHQAFRIGTSAWGVQFHPEVSPTTYSIWAEGSKETGEALQRVVDGLATVERRDDAITVGAEALARSFARVVTSRRLGAELDRSGPSCDARPGWSTIR